MIYSTKLGYKNIDSSVSRRNSAFTLAEVLITLGVIGVVAAMTIPNLITEHQKRTTVTKIQRAMSVLNQAYRLAYDEVGEASTSEAFALGSDEYFNKYWAPYLKTVHVCKTLTDCGYANDAQFISPSGNVTGIVSKNNRLTLKTFDGFTYVIMTAMGTSDGTMAQNGWIIVDINGGKEPNKYGKDVFVFVRTVDGEKGGVVLPYGADRGDTSINNDCTTVYGITCAEKIRRAGWKIEKDYPW